MNNYLCFIFLAKGFSWKLRDILVYYCKTVAVTEYYRDLLLLLLLFFQKNKERWRVYFKTGATRSRSRGLKMRSVSSRGSLRQMDQHLRNICYSKESKQMNLNTRTEGGSNGVKLLQCGQIIGSSELWTKNLLSRIFCRAFT